MGTADRQSLWLVADGITGAVGNVVCVGENFSLSKLTYQHHDWVVLPSLYKPHFYLPFQAAYKGQKMPVVIMASGIFFNLANTFLMGYYFIHFAKYDINWLYSLKFIIGIILFFCGVLINWKADNILIHLRKPDEVDYKIPQGWLFTYISCPNMLGELIEWAGFAILCWNMPAVAFFIWSAANLIPRAMAHHRWYNKQFIEYPKERKAIIPLFF